MGLLLRYWIWLSRIGTWKTETIKALLARFQDPKAIYYGKKQDFLDIPGLWDKLLEGLMNKSLLEAQRILADCHSKRIKVLTFGDAAYPERLRNIPDAPVVLYYRGTLPRFDGEAAIAVVGTRKASSYGMLAAKRMGFQIAQGGGLLVSGMASGIDSSAMRGALSAGRPVVAVFGCGVDVIYPRSEWSLYEDTAIHGCMLSEYPPGTSADGFHFPQRNRIISGLSCGVLVVEAPEKSGALITARRALDQGRDVFSVPGNIDVPSCAGSNRLLREGAIAVTSGYEVLEEYQWLFPEKILPFQVAAEVCSPESEGTGCRVAEPIAVPAADPPESARNIEKQAFCSLTPDQQTLVTMLEAGKLPVDELIAGAGIPAARVLAALTILEIQGMVIRLPGKIYLLAQDSENI